MVIKFINSKPNFCYHFKKIFKRYKKIGYSMDIMRPSVCLVVNPMTVYSYDFRFNCMTVDQAQTALM